jgi:hypothetical protein
MGFSPPTPPPNRIPAGKLEKQFYFYLLFLIGRAPFCNEKIEINKQY